MINLILLGLPGAGKGTASERIVDKYLSVIRLSPMRLESSGAEVG